MQERSLLVAVMAVAVAAALWFRRRPLSTRQRAVAVALAIGLLAFDFLRPGEADWGKATLVAAGSAVLIMAMIFLKRSENRPHE
jgi:hypothetical protein